MIIVKKECHKNEYRTIYTGTCQQCGSIVEFAEEDTDEREWAGRGIGCPVCSLARIPVKNCQARQEKLEASQCPQPLYGKDRALEAFCTSICQGRQTRDTCTSLGTCDEYDNFKKALEGGEE